MLESALRVYMSTLGVLKVVITIDLGLQLTDLCVQEVLEVAEQNKDKLKQFVTALVSKIAANS